MRFVGRWPSGAFRETPNKLLTSRKWTVRDAEKPDFQPQGIAVCLPAM